MPTRLLAVPVLLFALLGCTGVPRGLAPVEDFELDRYLGTWYEIARLDHRFERGLEDISATYTLREDGGVRVRNRGYDVEAGEWREAIGRAYPIGDPSVASLRVSFFGPFYAGYHVFELDPDYEVAMVTSATRDSFWLLSRARTLAPERREALVTRAREAGFDVDALIWVDQTRDDPALGS